MKRFLGVLVWLLPMAMPAQTYSIMVNFGGYTGNWHIDGLTSVAAAALTGATVNLPAGTYNLDFGGSPQPGFTVAAGAGGAGVVTCAGGTLLCSGSTITVQTAPLVINTGSFAGCMSPGWMYSTNPTNGFGGSAGSTWNGKLPIGLTWHLDEMTAGPNPLSVTMTPTGPSATPSSGAAGYTVSAGTLTLSPISVTIQRESEPGYKGQLWVQGFNSLTCAPYSHSKAFQFVEGMDYPLKLNVLPFSVVGIDNGTLLGGTEMSVNTTGTGFDETAVTPSAAAKVDTSVASLTTLLLKSRLLKITATTASTKYYISSYYNRLGGVAGDGSTTYGIIPGLSFWIQAGGEKLAYVTKPKCDATIYPGEAQQAEITFPNAKQECDQYVDLGFRP